MKPVSYSFEAAILIEFTKDDLDFLRPLCEHHYDLTVKSLSTPGKGAILNAAEVCLRDDSKSQVRVTYRQLDTLRKALEGVITDDDARKAAHLYMKMGWWMRDLRNEERRIERLVQPPPQYDELETAKTDPPPPR